MEEEKFTQIPEARKANLLTIGKWAKFLGIFYAVLLPAMIIAGIVFIVGGSLDLFAGEAKASMIIIGAVYIVAAGVMVFPVVYLLRGANAFLASARNDDEARFDEGLSNFKSFVKFIGIYLIAAIGLSILVCIGVCIFVAVAAI